MKIKVGHVGGEVEVEVHPAVAAFIGRWLEGGEPGWVPGWVRCVGAGGGASGVNLAEAVTVERLDGVTVTGLSPATAVAGDATDLTLTVEGTGFTPATVILFNGLEEPTTYVSATAVTTGVKPSLFMVPATCPVSVVGATASVPFEFTAAG